MSKESEKISIISAGFEERGLSIKVAVGSDIESWEALVIYKFGMKSNQKRQSQS